MVPKVKGPLSATGSNPVLSTKTLNMYVLNNQSQGDSGLEPRITDSEYEALKFNLKNHYHEEEEDTDETDFGDSDVADSIVDDSFNADGYDQDTTSTDDDSSQFDGFGGGDFGGGGSSDDY